MFYLQKKQPTPFVKPVAITSPTKTTNTVAPMPMAKTVTMANPTAPQDLSSMMATMNLGPTGQGMALQTSLTSQNLAQQSQMQQMLMQYQILLSNSALQSQLMSINHQFGTTPLGVSDVPQVGASGLPLGALNTNIDYQQVLSNMNPLSGVTAVPGRGMPSFMSNTGGTITTNMGVGRGLNRSTGDTDNPPGGLQKQSENQ